MALSIAYVTDIHYGFDQANKRGSQAPRLIKRFVAAANKNKADIAVNGGDRVIKTNHETDLHHATALSQEFNALSMPHHQVDGNHDRRYLSNAENAALFGVPEGSYTLDIKGYRCVFWNPSVRIHPVEGLRIEKEETEWLKGALRGSPHPCILFSHIPLDNSHADNVAAMKQDNRPFMSFYPQAEEVRDILEEAGNVRICIAGHRHRNRHREINGIHYLTHQSLVQKYRSTNRPHGAFSIFTFQDDGRIGIRGYGLGQRSYTLPALTA